jgi:hypothetical protein
MKEGFGQIQKKLEQVKQEHAAKSAKFAYYSNSNKL